MSTDEFKSLVESAKDTISELRPGIEDVLKDSGPNLSEKLIRTEKAARAIERFRSKQSGNEIFSEFGKDAAEEKVLEMFTASTSSDRQRASETVLAYAYGKPVERTISLNAQIGNMDKNELILKILEKVNKIGADVGIEGGLGATSSLLIPSREDSGREQTQELQTAPTETGNTGRAEFSGEVLEKLETD